MTDTRIVNIGHVCTKWQIPLHGRPTSDGSWCRLCLLHWFVQTHIFVWYYTV